MGNSLHRSQLHIAV